MLVNSEISAYKSETEVVAEEFLRKLLPYPIEEKQRRVGLQTTPQSIYEQLELSNKFKLGSLPTNAARLKNIDVVTRAVETETPIPVVVTIGTSKWYDGSHQNDNVAGLSELLMFEQLVHLDQRVKQLYKPGLAISLVAEDITNQWLYGQVFPKIDIAANNLTYLSSIELFTTTLKLTAGLDITLQTELELLQRSAVGKREYVAFCEANKKRFMSLFVTSNELETQFQNQKGVEWTEELWEAFETSVLASTEAYQELKRVGWQGAIHPKVRNFYLQQFEKSIGKKVDETYLAAYFAGVLARKQVKALQLAAHNKDFIKVAFLRYPQGSLKEQSNAIQVSQHPLTGFGSSHQHISPWASQTFLTVNSEGGVQLQVQSAKTALPAGKPHNFWFHYRSLAIPVTAIHLTT